MKELIKPNKLENNYEKDTVKGLCPELRSCTNGPFDCRRTQSADLGDDEILF